ncbi:MAG: hypothetical protein DDT42_02026 [candidate division WS2 bacterium]|uniref:Uncharacterized protein n=1 Tax=Psychracetigena formicireducens TaxID=2986056 RepID=A0A9E2F238_PSYF1|nr:hypothetical protein [Candidatus Psychracetigena formicireducens]
MKDISAIGGYIVVIVIGMVLTASVVPVAFDHMFAAGNTTIGNSTVRGINIQPVGAQTVGSLFIPRGDRVAANITGSVSITGATPPVVFTYQIIVNDAVVVTRTASATHTFDHDISAFLVAGRTATVRINTTANTNVTAAVYEHTVHGNVRWDRAIMGIWGILPLLMVVVLLLFWVGRMRIGGG